MTKNGIELTWNNLNFSIEENSMEKYFPPKRKKVTKTILRGLYGKVSSGSLLAVIGPSGCGKSTLLKCLSDPQRKGITGEISRLGSQCVRLAFISQDDHLLRQLTVKESLIFATRSKNYHIDKKSNEDKESALFSKNIKMNDHLKLVSATMEEFGLESAANVKVMHCSGGQRKRLSIASEVISQPDLLILDEPTSGLDSSSCLQCIKVLQRLISKTNPLAIIITIHQPSARILSHFTHLYVLCMTGECIYNGIPSQMVDELSTFGLHCPKFHNVADYVTEIAIGEHGHESLQKLVKAVNEKPSETLEETVDSNEKIITVKKPLAIDKTAKDVLLLTWRSLVVAVREPLLTSLRLITYLFTALVASTLYGKPGKANGCRVLYASQQVQDDGIDTNENVSFLFFTLLFMLFAGLMPTVITFPLEISVFLKEHRNGWYKCSSYYTAKFLSDAPFQLFFPLLYCSISYFMTGQESDAWRFLMFTVICCIMSFLSQSVGLLIGAIFVNNLNAAVFLAPITTIPVLLFSGFFVKFSRMPGFFKFCSYFSYMRYALDALLLTCYGFDRCSHEKSNGRAYLLNSGHRNVSLRQLESSLVNEMVNETLTENSTPVKSYLQTRFQPRMISYVMTQFDISDSELWKNSIILLSFILIIRLLTYFILLYQVKRHK